MDSDEERRRQNEADARRREDEERRNSAPTLASDGSLKIADLGGGLSLNSDGHLHLGGIDLSGS